MSHGIFEDETILLHECDFPDYFENNQHPDDFKPRSSPITEYIFHRLTDHNRIYLRICVKITETMFIPLTFICDTCAPSHIYISALTRRLISSRINTDPDTGINFLNINSRNFVVKPSPGHHPEINMIGLLALEKFGLCFREGKFILENLPEYF